MYPVNVNDLDLNNILLNEKSDENYLICNVTCKPPYGAKPSCIRKYDRTKYLA